MSNVTAVQTDLFITDVKAFITGERRMSKLAPFYAALVADGFGTSNEDARKIAVKFGAYEACKIAPDAPVTAVDGRGVKVKTNHGLLLQRIGQGIRVATESKQNTTKNLLTATGKAATLAEVTAEWKAAQS